MFLLHACTSVYLYLRRRRWRRWCFHPSLSVCSFVRLFVYLCVGYLKKLWTDPDEIWWAGWLCDKDELIRFWWRSESRSGYENYLIDKVILHHWEIGPKMTKSMIFQKCIGPNMFSWIRPYVAEVCALPSAIPAEISYLQTDKQAWVKT